MSGGYFEIGKPVSDERFFGRKKELAQLEFFLHNNQSIVIIAPRKYGKTSLVKKYLSCVTDKLIIEIDLMRYLSKKEIADAVIDKCYENIGTKKAIHQMKSGMLSFSKKLASMVKINMGVLELEGLERFFHTDVMSEDEYLLYAFEFVEKFALSTGKKAIFFIDEFAELSKFSDTAIMGQLRSIIQHQQHTAYIFAGSQPTLMNTLFLDKNEPFFKFATVLTLGAIDEKSFSQYARMLFEKEKMICDDSTISDIYTFCGGVAYYLSLSMMFLWMMKPSTCTPQIIDEVQSKVLEVSAFGFENEIIALKRRKYFLEIVLTIANGTNPYTLKTTQRQNINTILKSLELDGVILKKTDGFVLSDTVFGKYLRTVMG